MAPGTSVGRFFAVALSCFQVSWCVPDRNALQPDVAAFAGDAGPAEFCLFCQFYRLFLHSQVFLEAAVQVRREQVPAVVYSTRFPC
jgi:hypothetical protein